MDYTDRSIVEVLSQKTGHTLTLQRLHNALVREIGPAAGSYHQLYHRLKRAPEQFQLHELPNPLLDEAGWPRELREQYSGALQGAGLDLSPLVSLAAEPDAAPGLLSDLQHALAVLRRQPNRDPQLSADLLATLGELPLLQDALEQVQPTTIHLRNPREEPSGLR